MRPLSESQARRCETAKGGRCRCRCAGAFHGAARISPDDPRQALEDLAADDPHRIPPKATRKARICRSGKRKGNVSWDALKADLNL